MSHIKHRTDFQLTSEINCYVRKVMMKERQRDMKRKNVLHEREMRRVAMNSKRPSTAQAVMRSMEVKTPKDSGGKKNMRRPNTAAGRRSMKEKMAKKNSKIIAGIGESNGLEEAEEILKSYTSRVPMLSGKIKKAHTESKLSFLLKTVSRKRGPGHYKIDKASYLKKKQQMLWQAMNHSLPNVPLNLRRPNPRAMNTAAAQQQPGPADYDSGEQALNNRPHTSSSFSFGSAIRSSVHVGLREKMMTKERRSCFKDSDPSNFVKEYRTKLKEYNPEAREASRMDKRERREWKQGMVEFRRKRIETERMERNLLAVYRSSNEYMEEKKARKKKKEDFCERQKQWIGIIHTLEAFRKIRKIVEKGRSRSWRNRILSGLFKGPWSGAKDRAGGQVRLIQMLRKFLFKRMLTRWVNNQVRERKRKALVIVSTLKKQQVMAMRKQLIDEMLLIRRRMMCVQRHYQQRRRVIRWRKVILRVRVCIEKLRQQQSFVTRNRRRLWKILFLKFIPSLDIVSVERLSTDIFRKRLEAYNLAIMQHAGHYKKQLEKMLLKLFGASNAISGLEYSIIDFEMVCEMLQPSFPEKKSAAIFKLMDEDHSGKVSFEEFVNFYYKRFHIHRMSSEPITPIDPIDASIVGLIKDDPKPIFRLALTAGEKVRVRREVKMLPKIQRTSSTRNLQLNRRVLMDSKRKGSKKALVATSVSSPQIEVRGKEIRSTK